MARILIVVAVIAVISYCQCLPVKVEEGIKLENSDFKYKKISVINEVKDSEVIIPSELKSIFEHKIVKRSPGVLKDSKCPEKTYRAGTFCLSCTGVDHPDCGAQVDYSDDAYDA